jgi:transposase-like protein
MERSEIGNEARGSARKLESVRPRLDTEGVTATAPTMDEQTQNTNNSDLIKLLLDNGLSAAMPRMAELIMNAAMLIERDTHLQATPYERCDARTGYANGFKPRNFNTPMGKLDLLVPQVRDCGEPFQSSLLEKGSRSDRALKAAIATMYIQGVSTRKVTKIVEQLCGLEISSTQVSRLTAELDEELEKWRNRPLPEIAHLIIDASYYKVRLDGCVRDCAVLIAIGVRRSDGKRMILGISCAISEAELHWRKFLNSLKERGMGIPDLVTSDAHHGIKAALRATLNSSPWQRCQFHLQQNAQAYVPKRSMKTTVAADIKNIFNAPDRAHAELLLTEAVKKYDKSAPELSRWMETNIPEGLTAFSFPEQIRRRLRTSNMCETLNSLIKRRTRVVGLFPNENALKRLVTAVLMEISEDWEIGKAYLTISPKN